MKGELIIWQKKWGTGINTIDEQHKHFVRIINQVYFLNEDGKDKKVLGEIIHDLVEYARVHFSTEEGFFEETDYPQTEEHEQKHQELLTKVLDFTRRFESEEDISELVKDFLNFLKNWLDEHLIKVDHEYVPWLTEHGVK